jgi:23S rRNA pseudouridine1911/1915/1917 synthase
MNASLLVMISLLWCSNRLVDGFVVANRRRPSITVLHRAFSRHKVDVISRKPSRIEPFPRLLCPFGPTTGVAFSSTVDDVAEEYRHYTCPSGQSMRLDSFLSSVLPDLSRSYFASVCDEDVVLVNNKIRRKSFQVKENDRVSIPVNYSQASQLSAFNADLVPTPINLNILYEDADVVAVNKPSGMIVHPAPGVIEGTFANALLHHLGANAATSFRNEVADDSLTIESDGPISGGTFPIPPSRIGIVHRLDKGTTGVLLAAKNLYSTRRLTDQFMNRQTRKTYLAVCFGNPKCRTLDNYIGNDPADHKLMAVVPTSDDGRKAVSHIRTIASNGTLSLCAIRIDTGRWAIHCYTY